LLIRRVHTHFYHSEGLSFKEPAVAWMLGVVFTGYSPEKKPPLCLAYIGGFLLFLAERVMVITFTYSAVTYLFSGCMIFRN